MKKVVYLLEYPIDLPGGAQMSTLSVCEGLTADSSLGYETVVICPGLLSHDKSEYPFRIDEYPMGENRGINLIKRIGAFRKYIREEEPDLIHIEMSESLITYGFIRGSFKDIPCIYTDRGLLFGYRKRSRFFMDPVLRDCRMLVTTTEYNKGLWSEGSDIRPISVIPNTVSTRYFGDYDPKKRVAHEKPVIGLAGRICPEKDWMGACGFIDELAASGLDFRVSIVLSTFEKGDDDKAAEIIERLKRAVGEDNVESHLNYDQQQMSDFYYGVDIFLMTSCFESFGKAAVEAMSRKCAVVSTDVGGLPEVVGLPGNLYSRQDFHKGVACVKMLAENPEELDRQREYFYNRYLENYTEKRYIERHVELYDGII